MDLELIQPDYNNDFNYPSLERKDLMLLGTINSRDCTIKKINQINSNRDWSINLYNLDIEKTVPTRRNVFTNKIDFINKIDDIEKARPNKEIILKKPNFILNVRDIEKAYPKKHFWKSDRHINPLNPVYKLPSFKLLEPEVPKFIRDQIDISDIEKTKPNKLYPMKMRPFKTYDEIEGVHPKKRYERKVIHDSLNCSDLNIKKRRNRNTNPLEPEYDNPYGGYINGTKPCVPFSDFFKDTYKDHINVKDIDGASHGSLNHYSSFKYDNKQRFDTRDIDGGFCDTRKHGITTERCTNPLQPRYKYIGNNDKVNSYGEKINANRVSNNLNNSMLNPKIDKIENDKNNFNKNNSIKNSLAFSQDFFNIPKTDRETRIIHKSLSCQKINPQLPYLYTKKINNRESIRYKILKENEKNEPEEKYNNGIYDFYKQNSNVRDLKKNNIILRNHYNSGLNKNNKSYITNRKLNIDDEISIINNCNKNL